MFLLETEILVHVLEVICVALEVLLENKSYFLDKTKVTFLLWHV